MVADNRKCYAIIFGFALLVGGFLLYGCDSKSGKVVIGREAPNFTYRGLDGETGELKDLKGKVVILRFWADWCPYCAVEMPIIEKFYGRMKDNDFIVLAVNVKQSESVARAFVKKLNLSYPIALDQKGKITEQYEVKGIPINFIINKEGVLKEVLVGAISDVEMLEEYLKPYFG